MAAVVTSLLAPLSIFPVASTGSSTVNHTCTQDRYGHEGCRLSPSEDLYGLGWKLEPGGLSRIVRSIVQSDIIHGSAAVRSLSASEVEPGSLTVKRTIQATRARRAFKYSLLDVAGT